VVEQDVRGIVDDHLLDPVIAGHARVDVRLDTLDSHSRADTSVDSGFSLAAASESPQQRQDVGKPVAPNSGMLAEEKPSSPIFPGNPPVPMP